MPAGRYEITAIPTFSGDVEPRPLTRAELTSVLTGSGFRGVEQGLPHGEINAEAYPLRVRGFYPLPGELDVMERRNPVIAAGQAKIEYYASSLDWELRDPGSRAQPATAEEIEHAALVRDDLDELDGGLSGLIRQLFSFTQHGFVLFEKIWRIDELRRFRLDELLWINPCTIEKWVLDLAGRWIGFLCRSERGRRFIPRRKCLHNARRYFGRNPEGESAYRSCIYFDRAKSAELQSDRITRERWGEGTLKWTPPEGGGAEGDESTIRQISELWESGDQSYLIPPPGWESTIEHGASDMPDPIPRLEYFDHMVARVSDDTLSELGQAKFGSQALGREMRLATQRQLTGVCSEVCRRALDQDIIRDYFALNGWRGRRPRAAVGGFEDKERIMLIVELVRNKVVHMTPDREEAILRAVGLPA